MKRILFFSLIIGLFAFSAFAQGTSDGGRANGKSKGGGGDTGGKNKVSSTKMLISKGGSETGSKGRTQQIIIADVVIDIGRNKYYLPKMNS